MITGLDKNETIEYVSVLDNDKNNPTKFILGVLTGKERLQHAIEFEKENNGKAYYELVKIGLKGIKNFKLKNGEIKNITVIDDEVLDLLPSNIIKELFGEIIRINYLSEEERKNS